MLVLTAMWVTAPASVLTMAMLTRPNLVAYVPPPITIPMTPRGTNPLIGSYMDNKFISMPQFTLLMVTRYYPYIMLTTMMTCLQTNASTIYIYK